MYNGLLRARLLGITTLDAFKSWMAEHNPQVFASTGRTSRIDPLPAISQQALRNLPTYKGTTIIDTTDPLEPEITVSYRAQTDYSKHPGLEADYEKGIFTRLGAAKEPNRWHTVQPLPNVCRAPPLQCTGRRHYHSLRGRSRLHRGWQQRPSDGISAQVLLSGRAAQA